MNTTMQYQMAEISTELNSVRSLLARVESQQASLLNYLSQGANEVAIPPLANDHYTPLRQGRLGDEYLTSLIGSGLIGLGRAGVMR